MFSSRTGRPRGRKPRWNRLTRVQLENGRSDRVDGVFVAPQYVTCSSKGHPLAVDVFEDDVYWVTTMDADGGHDAALLTMNKFTRNVHSAGHDVLTLLNDLRTEMVIAHPALQMPGQDRTAAVEHSCYKRPKQLFILVI